MGKAQEKNFKKDFNVLQKKIGNQIASFSLLDTFYLNLIYFTQFSEESPSTNLPFRVNILNIKKWFLNDTDTVFFFKFSFSQIFLPVIFMNEINTVRANFLEGHSCWADHQGCPRKWENKVSLKFFFLFFLILN